LETEANAQLATVGSPFMDGLIQAMSEQGASAVGWIAVDHLKRKGLQDDAQRMLLIQPGRVRFDDREPDFINDSYLQLNFRVTLLSEERRERLFVISVNLRSLHVNQELVDRLPQLAIGTELAPLSDAPRAPIETAYRLGRDHLRSHIAGEIEYHVSRIRKRFLVESGRVSGDYLQLVGDLERRRSHEADSKKHASLTQKIEAATTERDRKLRELGETYRLRVRGRLASARILSQPKSFFRIFFDHGTATRELTLAYDSVLDRLEPPACDLCHPPTTRIDVTADARIVCPSCAGKA